MMSSPLHSYIYNITAHGGHMDETWREIISLLVGITGNIDERDYLGRSPLQAAVYSIPESDDDLEIAEESHITVADRLEVVKYLLDKGANPNYADFRGNTCIYSAAANCSVDSLRLLIENGANAKVKNRVGMTAVYSICAEIEWETDEEIRTSLIPFVDQLINSGCDINAKCMDQSTVLHYAASRVPVTVVRYLCEKGARVNDRDYLGRTPLHRASWNSHPGIVHCLVEFNADIDARNINNDTPLHFACLLNNLDSVQALVDLGADVEAAGDLGIKPMHLAGENGSTELVNIVASRADASCKDMWGATPLHYAASDGNCAAVEVLLELGLDRNQRDYQNMTPLDYALFRGDSLKTARILAQDDTLVKFGNLPPLYFPNRPVIQIDQVDGYFDGLIEAFKTSGENGMGLAKKLLHSPGLGHLDLETGEAKEISVKATSLIEQMVKRIGELDPLFEADFLRAGSTYEDVKTGFPDEFDFLCNMVKFSSFIERIESSEAKGFSRVIMRDDSPAEVMKYCMHSTGRCINASFFLQRFQQLARQAMYDVLSRYNPQIYTGHMLVTENIPLFDPLVYQKTKLHGQTMTFRGRLHKFLDVSVDLNPVLFFPVLPDEFIQSCSLLGDISTRGIYLLPKHCAQIVPPPMATIPQSADLWRYSTHHLEAEVLHSLPKIGRECYVMCKLLRMEPMTHSVGIRSYNQMMSEEQLESLFPAGKMKTMKWFYRKGARFSVMS